jgi:hydrogenase maturation factor
MKAGKLKESVLKRSILKQLHTRNEKVIQGPSVGCDYGAIDVTEDEVVVLSTDPITASAVNQGRAAIYAATNDVASSGATPQGVSVSLLLPTSLNEEELRDIIKDMEAACKECSVDIIGGHTEVTRAVKEPLVTVTAVGTTSKENLVDNRNLCPGMDIVVSKWVGLEGTAILAKEKTTELRSRFPQPFIDKAKVFDQMMSVIPEAAVASKLGVCAMHDVSEGGVFGALWELAECADVGLEIDLKKIPVRQETIEICEFFDINPYKMMSGGSLLMATEDGNALVRELEKAGIFAAVIGKATGSNDRVLLNEEERRFLETTQTDEIYKAL